MKLVFEKRLKDKNKSDRSSTLTIQQRGVLKEESEKRDGDAVAVGKG